MKNMIRFSPSTGSNSPDVWGVYEADTGSIQYIVADPATRKAALIDVVQNFDPRSARTDFSSADQVLELVKEQNLEVQWEATVKQHKLAACYTRCK